MKTASIIVPNSYFNIIYDWCLDATDGDEPAAKLISVFRYHFDNRYANRILVELIERAMNRDRKHLRELGDWLPYSIDYMSELLLNSHGLNQIINGRKKLIEIGFISDEVPEDIPKFYSRSHSWYKFEVENIKDWLHRFWLPLQKRPAVFAPNVSEVREAISNVTGTDVPGTTAPEALPNADAPEAAKPEATTTEVEKPANENPTTLNKQINALGKFYIHIHAKNTAYILDNERKNRVRAMLKKMTETVGELRAISICAQAIIGNSVSDFHQGRHPENMLGIISEKTGNKGKIFDDIGEYIFKTAKKLDSMVDHAENAGITEEIALEEFKGFLSGKASRFSKILIKEAEKARIVQERAGKTQGQIAKEYRMFAHDVSSFFFTNVPNREILEMCQTNLALAKLGKGLTDSEALFNALRDSGKTFRNGVVSDKAANQMREFAKKFTTMQEFN